MPHKTSDRYTTSPSQIGWGDLSTSSAPNGCWRCLPRTEMVLTWCLDGEEICKGLKSDEGHGQRHSVKMSQSTTDFSSGILLPAIGPLNYSCNPL